MHIVSLMKSGEDMILSTRRTKLVFKQMCSIWKYFYRQSWSHQQAPRGMKRLAQQKLSFHFNVSKTRKVRYLWISIITHNLDHSSALISWPKFRFKLSTEFQLQNLDQSVVCTRPISVSFLIRTSGKYHSQASPTRPHVSQHQYQQH